MQKLKKLELFRLMTSYICIDSHLFSYKIYLNIFMGKKINSIKKKNKFEEMGFIKFWFYSTLFFVTFPISFLFCFLFFGFKETKLFITVLIKDYLQTILVIFIFSLSILIFIIYYLVSLFN